MFDTSAVRVPVATYRLQFNSQFTFRDARAIVEYLHTLGVTDCYASSYLKAVPGSGHGYDVADPTRLNPEVGSDADYDEWIRALKASGMGHIIDLVPNHMGIARSSNPWWTDVLENGPSSRFAHFFDIEWHPVKDELNDKVLIPILGDQYGAVLERQELKLGYRNGAFFVEYFDDWLPIAPDTFGRILADGLDAWIASHPGEVPDADADELRSIVTAADNLPPRASRDAEAIGVRAREKEVVKRRLAALAERSAPLTAFIERNIDRFNGRLGEPRSFDALDRLLNAQSYRLAFWRVASEEINYRRFFDVNQLVAIRMEDPSVFEEVHRFVFELVAKGAATGLRVDHVDGLFAPGDYLRRLRESRDELYIVVEKILGRDEQLSGDWPIQGTTGYEFAAVVNGLFVDRRHEHAMTSIYARFLRERREELGFADLAFRSKKLVMHETMSGDINALGHQLNRFSESNRHFRDFTLYSLISTLKEVIACFPVYRTYVARSGPISDHDRRYIGEATRGARRRTPGVATVVVDFIEQLLLKRVPAATPEECDEQARFIGKFQQVTSPVAAKGLEDTALYVYNRLLSLNEVGADPTRFGEDPAAVHQWMAERHGHWPSALSATSTHDTKRGEDARARLNALSEIPSEWKTAVARWRALNRRLKSDVRGAIAPSANEEYFIYQTLVAMWPLDDSQVPAVGDRLERYLIKALREAKVHTSWLSPDEEYESAVARFARGLLDPGRPFLQAFLPFQTRVARIGIYNSLAQLLIKATAPGVPDFYQGSELWDWSLVDPDNRRPVDYAIRLQFLDEIRRAPCPAADLAESLFRATADGKVKLFTIWKALQTRTGRRALFERGRYIAVRTGGAHRDNLFAFARSAGDAVAITCVPRLVGPLLDSMGRVPPERWEDTRIELPSTAAVRRLRDTFTGHQIVPDEADGGLSVKASRLFARFPVALLTTDAVALP